MSDLGVLINASDIEAISLKTIGPDCFVTRNWIVAMTMSPASMPLKEAEEAERLISYL